MKAILAVLVLGLSACATLGPRMVGRADMGKGGSVALLTAVCEGSAAAVVARTAREEFRDGWKRADGVFFMTNTQRLQSFAGCWRNVPLELSGGVPNVIVVFEDGDAFFIPLEKFDGRPASAKPAGVEL